MTTATHARLAVFASGGGSNLQAILDHLDALGAAAPAAPVLVLSDRADAGALGRARARGIAAEVVPRDRPEGIAAALSRHAVTHIALAGYLRLVPEAVTHAFRGRIVNVHPALLPAFGGPGMYGTRVHEAVLRSGARITGPTVHFVDARYDEGAIIAQHPVPVRSDDTAETLAARVLAAEHVLYPRCVAAVAAGEVSLGADGRARGTAAFDFDRTAPAGRQTVPAG